MARVGACRPHLAFTKLLLQAGDPTATVTTGPANVDGDGNPLDIPVIGCKGHMEGWPVAAG
jgi:hypothetical protein